MGRHGFLLCQLSFLFFVCFFLLFYCASYLASDSFKLFFFERRLSSGSPVQVMERNTSDLLLGFHLAKEWCKLTLPDENVELKNITSGANSLSSYLPHIARLKAGNMKYEDMKAVLCLKPIIVTTDRTIKHKQRLPLTGSCCC